MRLTVGHRSGPVGRRAAVFSPLISILTTLHTALFEDAIAPPFTPLSPATSSISPVPRERPR